jgi:hypothetical protein
MFARAFLAFALLALSPLAHSASQAQPITPLLQSVAGGETQVFSVRFLDAMGRPAAGEVVRFSNDACGAFANGQFLIDVVADGNGIASATFTARPQGIVCWLRAAAGSAQVTYNVLTYIPSAVYLSAVTDPPEVKPGQPFSLAVSAMQGAYRLYNVDISARILPGSGSASISTGSANTAQAGVVGFTVTPDNRGGSFDVEVQFRTRTQRVALAYSSAPWQDLWWAGPAEDGWGMSIVQHRDKLFGVIYAYDAAGKPVWYVMSDGIWNEANTVYSGPLYLAHGTPYSAYDASKLVVGSPVGQAMLDFTKASRVALDYIVDGVPGHKTIERLPFGPKDSTPGTAVGDMWWGGGEQNGWGIAVLQQYATLFSLWFTYDAAGKATWFAMPQGFWSDPQTYEGRIYRATGSPWLGAAYDPAAHRMTDVGTFRMRFAEDNGTFEYFIEGQGATLPFKRIPF